MKIATYLAGLIGLIGATLLMIHEGVGDVLHVLLQGGWGLLWLVPFHVLPLMLDAEGWYALLQPFDPQRRASRGFLLWIAAIREAVNRLLPTANVGGELVGIRLTKWRVPDGAAVTATIIVEVMITMIVQYLFTALGLILLIGLKQSTNLAPTILTGLALSLPVPIVFGALLRYGSVFERMERAVEGMLGNRGTFTNLIGGGGLGLDEAIRRLYSHRLLLLRGLLWQFAGYVLGAFETWLALRLLGHEVSPVAAIAVEALTQAVRHFAFIVPAGLGVQEASLVLFGQMIGVDHDISLSLSLAKRMREVIFGLPALLSWQWSEGRLLHRRWREQGRSTAES